MAEEKERDETSMEVEEVEEVHQRAPFIIIAELRFKLSLPDEVVPAAEKQSLKTELLGLLQKDSMVSYYQEVCKQFGLPIDEGFVSKQQSANAEELKRLDTVIEEAKKTAGDTEVREAYLARANFLARTADKATALKAYEETLTKTIGGGLKIDLVFAIIRFGFLYNDHQIVKTYLDKAKALVEEGGDWERRNLFKIYEAAYLLETREFKQAGTRLLDSIATFTCYELFDYNQYIFYTVLTSAMSVDRVTLRDKVVKSPEILASYQDIPHLRDFVESLYRCKYADFFRALSNLAPSIQRDRFLSAHFGYFLREIRVVAYGQFLQAYRSVKLDSMAESFGVTADFLDRELARFIANNRLNAKIDKVNGVVETNRPDAKNAQYQNVIKHGDVLITRIEKLSKIVSV